MINKDQIKQIITQLYTDVAVIIFGSYARNEQTSLSDIDLLVLFPGDLVTYEKRNIQAIIRKELAKQHIPADVLVCSRKEYLQKKQFTNHIFSIADKEGVLL
jgi:predicted nucleotidyltransferase